MAGKRTSHEAKSRRVFGQARKQPKMFRAGLYTRVSTNDQQTIPLQIRALREYAARRGWTIALQMKEVGSGASQRQLREKLLDAARRIQQLLPQLPLRCTGTDLFHLQGYCPAPPGGVFPKRADLQRDGLLVVRGDAGIQARPKHFRLLSCLAENPTRFGFVRSPFSGHF